MESFGDSAEEIMFFIENKYIPENTLVAEVDGEIASVLFLLDGKMCIKGVDYPSYYLYAACTLKKYRGRGIMASLLEEAKNIAFSRKTDFICLMPGEKSLFDFYERFGYNTAFSKKILTINTDEYSECFDITQSDVIDIELIRNNAYKNIDFFKWDSKSIEFAFSHNKMYSGKEFHNCNGYCLYSINGSVMSVKEFAFAEKDALHFALNIAKSNNCDKIILNLPSGYPAEIGKYEIVPSAMMLAVSERSKTVSDGLNNAYLGLTLD